MKKIFLFAVVVSVLSAANSFAETAIPKTPLTVVVGPGKSQVLTSVSLDSDRYTIDFNSQGGDSVTFNANQLDIPTEFITGNGKTTAALMASGVFEELKSTSHHYVIDTKGSSNSKNWVVQEVTKDKKVREQSMQKFAEMAAKRHEGPSDLGKLKNSIVQHYKDFRDAVKWFTSGETVTIVGANSVPQSSDQSASNRPYTVTAPSTTNSLNVIAGSTNL